MREQVENSHPTNLRDDLDRFVAAIAENAEAERDQAEAERDAAISQADDLARQCKACQAARVAAEADLTDVLDDADDFETVVRDEPERVLRAAEDVALRKGHDPDTLYTVMDVAEHLAEEADRLEREHAETAARDRLIAEAEATLTWIISGNVTVGYPRNAAASILAEYPGVINVLAEQEKATAEQATAEKAREALIEKAARLLFSAAANGASFGRASEAVQGRWLAQARALADAGLLADPDVRGDQ